jgi:hypothetical protein
MDFQQMPHLGNGPLKSQVFAAFRAREFVLLRLVIFVFHDHDQKIVAKTEPSSLIWLNGRDGPVVKKGSTDTGCDRAAPSGRRL